MTDVETRGGDELGHAQVMALECAVCGLDVCGHSDGLKREVRQLDQVEQVHGDGSVDAKVKAVHDLGGAFKYDNGLTG